MDATRLDRPIKLNSWGHSMLISKPFVEDLGGSKVQNLSTSLDDHPCQVKDLNLSGPIPPQGI